MTTTFKWNEETTTQVQEASADLTSYEQLEGIAEALGTTVRSVAAKLRNLGVEVPKKATATSKFTDEQADALGAYVTQNAGQFTYGEIAEAFEGGAFNAKQIQGKILAMELTANVKPTVHEKAPSKYTPEALETISAHIGTYFVAFKIATDGDEFISTVKAAIKSGEIIRTSITPANLKQVFDKWVLKIGQEIKGVSKDDYALIFFADISLSNNC